MPLQTDIATAATVTGELQKHPKDGWIIADPYPMGSLTSRALRGIIRALVPDPLPFQDVEERVENHIRIQMRYMHPSVAGLLTLAIHLLDWSPMWRFRSLRRLRNLPAPKASSVIEGLAHSRLGLFRMLVLGMRAMVGTCIYDQEEVHELLNYHPIPWMRQRIELRKRLLAGQDPTPDDLIGPYSHVRIEE